MSVVLEGRHLHRRLRHDLWLALLDPTRQCDLPHLLHDGPHRVSRLCRRDGAGGFQFDDVEQLTDLREQFGLRPPPQVPWVVNDSCDLVVAQRMPPSSAQ